MRRGSRIGLTIGAGLLAFVSSPFFGGYEALFGRDDAIKIGIREDIRQISPMPEGLNYEHHSKKGEIVELWRGVGDGDGIKYTSLTVNGLEYSQADWRRDDGTYPKVIAGICYIKTAREQFRGGENHICAKYTDLEGNVGSDSVILHLKE